MVNKVQKYSYAYVIDRWSVVFVVIRIIKSVSPINDLNNKKKIS